MPRSFQFALDYSVLVLVKIHPAIRIHHKLLAWAEVDVEFLLRPDAEKTRGDS